MAQAESIADLINASTEEAAQSAINSLSGKFSLEINNLLKYLIELRMYVEACLDFPEEDIDFITEGLVVGQNHNDDVRISLFVTTKDNKKIDEEEIKLIKSKIYRLYRMNPLFKLKFNRISKMKLPQNFFLKNLYFVLII